jgi:hypothetical protein
MDNYKFKMEIENQVNNNSNISGRNRIRHCGFCEEPGHTINLCTHPTIQILHDKILKAVAISKMFPFVGNKFIKRKLLLCSREDLKVLTYKFTLTALDREMLKTREGIMEWLTRKYSNTPYPYILPYYEQIVDSYRFHPDRSLMSYHMTYVNTEFLVSVRRLFPLTPEYALHIMNWHNQMLRDVRNEQGESISTMIREPMAITRKFRILTSVTEVVPEDRNFDCPICYSDEITQECSAQMNCGHTYCTDCMENYLENKSKDNKSCGLTCGMCREAIKTIQFKDRERANAIQSKYMVL